MVIPSWEWHILLDGVDVVGSQWMLCKILLEPVLVTCVEQVANLCCGFNWTIDGGVNVTLGGNGYRVLAGIAEIGLTYIAGMLAGCRTMMGALQD